jgi:hypothetical protein
VLVDNTPRISDFHELTSSAASWHCGCSTGSTTGGHTAPA